jgi:sulfatase modifying factor 1
MNARKMAVAGLAAMLLAAGGAMAQVSIETVPIGNPGNAGEMCGGPGGFGDYRVCGAVDYVYNIGKYEVTNAQYCAFLNAVDPDGTDPYELYYWRMGPDDPLGWGGISFTADNPNGSKYEVMPGRGNKPVHRTSFWDACRFANWLHNGQGSGDTETGAYTLTPDGIANNTVTRNPGWRWAVTSEDEWYKAAYYNPATGTYYDYPTGSNTYPTEEPPPGTDMVRGSVNTENAVYDVTDVGAYDAKPSASPYGTFDQGGNVWEYNESIYNMYGNYEGRGTRGGSLLWGGSYLHAGMRGMCQTAGDTNAGVGFRVVQVPEPAFAVLLIAGLGLVLRRRTNR